MIILSSCVQKTKTSYQEIDNDIFVENYISVDTSYFSDKSIKTLKYIKSDSEYVNIDFHESGDKKAIGTVKNGQVHGEYIDWFENGKIQWIRNYENGNQIGESKTYTNNGFLKKVYDNLENKVTYYYPNGKPKETVSNNIYIDYYLNGVVKKSFLRKTDKETTIEYFNENEEIVFKGKAVNDILYSNDSLFSGEIVCKFLNGEIAYSGKWLKGLSNGKMISKFGNGNLEFETDFINGKDIGVHIFYYENGKIKSSKNFKTGDFKQWDENGTLIE